MADVELLHPGERGHRPDVAGREAVPRVDAQAELVPLLGGGAHAGQVQLAVQLAAASVSVGVDLEAAHRAGEVGEARELLGSRVHEHRDGDAGGGQPLGRGAHRLELAHEVQASLGGELLGTLGHQRHLVRRHPLGDLQHLRRRRHLQVELAADGAAQTLDVLDLHVAAVAPQVGGDAARPGRLGEPRRLHGVGVGGAPRLAHGGDVVDVDGETGRHSYAPTASRMADSSRAACRSRAACSGPSSMMRASGSVPL